MTYFVTRYGTFQFKVMTFCLVSAPATLQRMMDGILRGLPFAKAYLDDILVLSRTMEKHMEYLRIEGLAVNAEKIEAIRNAPVQHDAT